MKWITREHPRVDRVACPWLIEKFVDQQAEFIYVPTDQVAGEAAKRGATPYDVKDAELGHHGPECSFDAFVHKYDLAADPAMAYMAKVIRGADTADKNATRLSAIICSVAGVTAKAGLTCRYGSAANGVSARAPARPAASRFRYPAPRRSQTAVAGSVAGGGVPRTRRRRG